MRSNNGHSPRACTLTRQSSGRLSIHTKESTMFRHVVAIVLAALALPALAAVEVNQATQAQLESVKGVGPALSSKILEARKTGPFKSWSDLQERVLGIGPGSAAKLSGAGMTVGGASFDAAAKATDKAADKPAARPAARPDAKPEQKTASK